MQTDYRDILLAIAAAALILCAVVIATMEPPAAEAPALADTHTPAITRPAEPDGTDAPADSSTVSLYATIPGTDSLTYLDVIPDESMNYIT